MMIGHKIHISPNEFKTFQEFIYKNIGISLSSQKVSLVESRLSKRLTKLNLHSFKEYYQYIQNNQSELLHLIDAISTNVTSFFREANQWEYLKENIQKILDSKSDKTIRIWSAACSSGQEPYSITMFLYENIKNIQNYKIKILATDISQEVLAQAQSGIYSSKEMESMPNYLVKKYFSKIDSSSFEIDNQLREMIMFRMFNLVYGDFKIFKNRFDIIFCRNVMIYFDTETQKSLVHNFRKILNRDSLLFVGHSESLTKNQAEFKLEQSSIYRAV